MFCRNISEWKHMLHLSGELLVKRENGVIKVCVWRDFIDSPADLFWFSVTPWKPQVCSPTLKKAFFIIMFIFCKAISKGGLPNADICLKDVFFMFVYTVFVWFKYKAEFLMSMQMAIRLTQPSKLWKSHLSYVLPICRYLSCSVTSIKLFIDLN